MATRRTPTPRSAVRPQATIRQMRSDDLAHVIALDARVFGTERHAYFERRLASLDRHDPASHTLGLVAEDSGAIVGFVMGTLTSGEFGFAEATVLIDSIAVAPGRQRHGIGRLLAETLVAEGAARGARDVYTLVNWNSWDMLKFFDSVDFGLAQTVLLHRRIGQKIGQEIIDTPHGLKPDGFSGHAHGNPSR